MCSLRFAAGFDLVAGTEAELQDLTTRLETDRNPMEWKLAQKKARYW